MMHINFEKDIPKHFVRKHGWLAAAKNQKQAIRRRSKKIPLRYFTFCAAEAIDVCMLEREGILVRSEEEGHLQGVYFCEKNPLDYARISDYIGLQPQGFQSEFEKIVLFEDDNDTFGKKYGDGNYYPSEIRKKLICKDEHHRLRDAFPFDIINLDVCGVMFPPRQQIIAPLLQSIIRIFRWQTESKFLINQNQCKRFTLFLTSHIDKDDTKQEVVEQLEERLYENISSSEDFRAAFFHQFGHTQADRLSSERYAEFFCVAFPKFLINEAIFQFGWKVTSGPTFLYKRDYRRDKHKQYQIMHTISVYERIPDFQQSLSVPNPSQYFESVTQLVHDGVKRVDAAIENPKISQELEEDLQQIVKFRNRLRNS